MARGHEQGEPTDSGEVTRIRKYLAELKAERSHSWPIESARLLTYIGADAWVTCVNAERDEPLERDAALGVRAKLFDE